MKGDNLKHFIDSNREAFDSLEPSADVWQSINSHVGMKPSAFKTLVKKGWIKYGLSSLVIGSTVTYLVATSDTGKPKDVPELAQKAVVEHSPEMQEATDTTKEVSVQREIMKEPKKENVVLKGSMDSTRSFVITEAMTPVNDGGLMFTQKEFIPVNDEKPPVIEEKSITTLAREKKKEAEIIVDTLFSGIKRIEVRSAICDVNIKARAGNEVVVKGNINIQTKGITLNAKNNYKINFEKADSVLLVNVVCHQISKPVVVFGVLKSDACLNFEIPKGVEMKVEGSSGNINMEDLNAKTLEVKTSFGDIKARQIEADLKLTASSGDIKAQQITGTLITETQFGDQRFENVMGDLLIRSSSGDIIAKQIKGKINSKSSFGDQTYEMLSGDLVSVCGSGDIKLDETKGNLKLHSKFGDIRGEKVEVTGDSEIETSSGDIIMDFSNDIESLGFNLHTNSGDIKVKTAGEELRSEKRILVENKDLTVKGFTKFGDQTYK
jgi:hypothetical protein